MKKYRKREKENNEGKDDWKTSNGHERRDVECEKEKIGMNANKKERKAGMEIMVLGSWKMKDF